MNLKEYLTKKGKVPKGLTDWLYFCDLEIKSGKLWAGDPNLCNKDDGCVVKVPKGKYVVEGIGMPFGGRDRVVSRLRVRLAKAKTNLKLGKELGDTGTDCGAIGVGEIDAFEKAYKKEGGADRVQAAAEALDGQFIGILTVPEFPDCYMPFVPTGSDGNGPILAVTSGGKLVGVELPFMGEDDV